MAERRRYTKRQKVTAILAADMTSQEAAAEASGIPRTTIRNWLKDPELAELRHNAREALKDEAVVTARLAWGGLIGRIRLGQLDNDQLITVSGMATDKALLLSGLATSRTETKALSDGLDDHEKAALRDLIEGALAEPAPADPGGDTVGAGAEVRQ